MSRDSNIIKKKSIHPLENNAKFNKMPPGEYFSKKNYNSARIAEIIKNEMKIQLLDLHLLSDKMGFPVSLLQNRINGWNKREDLKPNIHIVWKYWRGLNLDPNILVELLDITLEEEKQFYKKPSLEEKNP